MVCGTLSVIPISPNARSADAFAGSAVAEPVTVAGVAHNGDIISFDPVHNTYQASQVYDDRHLFGIVADDPVLYLVDTNTQNNTRPVVRFGAALVNVSTIRGEIHAGDYVTSSVIAGVGARTDIAQDPVVIGIATSDMTIDTAIATQQVGGVTVRFGTVPVSLQVGMRPMEQTLTATGTGASVIINSEQDRLRAVAANSYLMIARYVLAVVVTLLAVIIALRNFGGTMSQGVVSIGRNPLARSYIMGMVLWNSLLILIVSGVGLAIGAAIILLP